METENVVVSSWLDYCNLLFGSLSSFNVWKLQSVQNNLTKIVTNTTRYSHVTPALKSLHGLPVQQHSVFKTATIVCTFLQSGYPKYLITFLNFRKYTRSTNMECKFLEVPQFIPSGQSLQSNVALVLPMMLPLSRME